MGREAPQTHTNLGPLQTYLYPDLGPYSPTYNPAYILVSAAATEEGSTSTSERAGPGGAPGLSGTPIFGPQGLTRCASDRSGASPGPALAGTGTLYRSVSVLNHVVRCGGTSTVDVVCLGVAWGDAWR